jgi:hypothetical protein
MTEKYGKGGDGVDNRTIKGKGIFTERQGITEPAEITERKEKKRQCKRNSQFNTVSAILTTVLDNLDSFTLYSARFDLSRLRYHGYHGT